MKINTKINIGDKIYRINSGLKSIEFVVVEDICINVARKDSGSDRPSITIFYTLSNGDKVIEGDMTEENNYYINIRSAGDALDELF